MTPGPDSISSVPMPATIPLEAPASDAISPSALNNGGISNTMGHADSLQFIGAMNNIIKGFADAMSTTQRELITREIQKFLTLQNNVQIFEAKDLNAPEIKAIESLQNIYKVIQETTSKALYNAAAMNASASQGASLEAQQKDLQQTAAREALSILMSMRAAKAYQKQKKREQQKIGIPSIRDIDNSTC